MSAQNVFQRDSGISGGSESRRVNWELDLNRSPPREIEEEESHSAPPPPPPPPQLPRIGVDFIEDHAADDDIIETSPRAFAQATSARRTPRRITVRVVSTDESRANDSNNIEYRRVLQRTPMINSVNYISSEGCSNSLNGNADAGKAPEPPNEPIFTCPICLDNMTEEMSTICGHIFCKKCIRAAIAAQRKCPTCRKKIGMKDLIRVYLPSANSRIHN